MSTTVELLQKFFVEFSNKTNFYAQNEPGKTCFQSIVNEVFIGASINNVITNIASKDYNVITTNNNYTIQTSDVKKGCVLFWEDNLNSKEIIGVCTAISPDSTKTQILLFDSQAISYKIIQENTANLVGNIPVSSEIQGFQLKAVFNANSIAYPSNWKYYIPIQISKTEEIPLTFSENNTQKQIPVVVKTQTFTGQYNSIGAPIYILKNVLSVNNRKVYYQNPLYANMYINALEYLRYSGTASLLLDELDNGETTCVIELTNDLIGGQSFLNSVIWNPWCWWEYNSVAQIISPSLILLHELVHRKQIIDNIPDIPRNDEFHSEHEYSAIIQEHTVASELHNVFSDKSNEFLRQNHNKPPYFFRYDYWETKASSSPLDIGQEHIRYYYWEQKLLNGNKSGWKKR